MPNATAIILLIMILGEDPGTVCCGWTRGWVIKIQPKKMTEKCTPLINAGPRLNAGLV